MLIIWRPDVTLERIERDGLTYIVPSVLTPRKRARERAAQRAALRALDRHTMEGWRRRDRFEWHGPGGRVALRTASGWRVQVPGKAGRPSARQNLAEAIRVAG